VPLAGILHLATHGFFLADQERDAGGEARIWRWGGMGRVAGPELENPCSAPGSPWPSHTWLEGGHPPLEAEDGLLTAEDVSGLDLLGDAPRGPLGLRDRRGWRPDGGSVFACDGFRAGGAKTWS